MQLLQTPSGVEYGLLSEPSGQPAPLLLYLGGTIADALTNPDFCRVCDLLVDKGWLAVSIDLPVHGKDVREGETGWDMGGWRARLERGEDLLGDFIRRGTAVLDHLVQTGQADPARIAAAGCSRGGFSALHFAAVDGRPRWIGAIAPLTDVTLIREFVGAEYCAAARAVSVHHLADRLAGKAVWICIGNDDRRVSTESAIAFSRRLVEANKIRGLKADVELHVLNYDGHLSTIADHDALFNWLYSKVNLNMKPGYGSLTLR